MSTLSLSTPTSFTCSPAHSLAHSHVSPFTPLARSPTHPLSHPSIHSLTHSPTQSLVCLHKLNRPEQVILFRPRTGHNRLNAHMYSEFKVGKSEMRSCKPDVVTAEHPLQHCRLHDAMRRDMWPEQRRHHDCRTPTAALPDIMTA